MLPPPVGPLDGHPVARPRRARSCSSCRSPLCGYSKVGGMKARLKSTWSRWRDRVDRVEVADALVLDQAGDRPQGDRQRPAVDLRPLRIQPRVADDVERALRAVAMLGGDAIGGADRRRPAPPCRRPRASPGTPCPPASTSIITGGNVPGIAAEAIRILWTSSSARGTRVAAISVTFQMTGRRASRFVVAIEQDASLSRARAAIASSISCVTDFLTSFRRGRVSAIASPKRTESGDRLRGDVLETRSPV